MVDRVGVPGLTEVNVPSPRTDRQEMTWEEHDKSMNNQRASSGPYARFALNMGLSLFIMYFLMFSMIDDWETSGTT